MAFNMIHVCLRVLDLEASERFYANAFGYEVSRKKDYPENFTLLYMVAPGAPFELELTYNYDQTEPYELGNGYSHVAVGVEHLNTMVEHVADVEVPSLIQYHVPDVQELSRARAASPPLTQESAIWVEHLNTVVSAVAHKDLTRPRRRGGEHRLIDRELDG